MGGRGQGSGAAGDQCICFKRKMYLFQVQNVFVSSAKCICFKCKMYLFKVQNLFVKAQNIFVYTHISYI